MGHGRRTDVFSYINLQIVQPDYLHVGCKMKATCHILVNDLHFVPDRDRVFHAVPDCEGVFCT